MRRFFVFVWFAILAVGCETTPQWLELTKVPVELTQDPRSFVPQKPARTNDDVVCLCIQASKEYELLDDFSLHRRGSERVHFRANAMLENGRTVSLSRPSSFGPGMSCLKPEVQLNARLIRVTITASHPIIVEKVMWVNTHK